MPFSSSHSFSSATASRCTSSPFQVVVRFRGARHGLHPPPTPTRTPLTSPQRFKIRGQGQACASSGDGQLGPFDHFDLYITAERRGGTCERVPERGLGQGP